MLIKKSPFSFCMFRQYVFTLCIIVFPLHGMFNKKAAIIVKWLNNGDAESADSIQIYRRASLSGIQKLIAFNRFFVSAVDSEDNTVLHIRLDDLEPDVALIHIILQAGANVNAVNRYLFTPLRALMNARYAVERQITLAHMLINYKANINALDEYNRTPLWAAVTKDDSSHNMVEFLLSMRANVHTVTDEGETALIKANKYSNMKSVSLLEKEEQNVPLNYPCPSRPYFTQCIDIINKRYASSGVVLNEQDIRRFVSECHPRTYTYLLHWAIEYNNMAFVKTLIDLKADPNSRYCGYFTPLVTACYSKNLTIVDYLIKAGANPNGDRLYRQSTPLIRAVQYGNCSVITCLVDAGADVQGVDVHLNTALHEINKEDEKFDSFLLADYLITKNASVHAKNLRGATPLHYAGSSAVVEVLLKAGADINATDNKGNTVLHYKVEEDDLTLLATLLDAGVQINGKNNRGDTALLIKAKTAKGYYGATTALLLQYDADPSIPNDKGQQAKDFLSMRLFK